MMHPDMTARPKDTVIMPCLSLLCREGIAVLKSDPNPRMRSSISGAGPRLLCDGVEAPAGGRPPSFHRCTGLGPKVELRWQSCVRR